MSSRSGSRALAAVDLGAESGRVMLARFDGQGLTLDEAHRFPNQPVSILGHRFWNILGLWSETLAGLRKARSQAGALDSVGVDTWGVDYGLVNEAGLLASQPYHYRDHRTDGMMERVFATTPRDEIYARTGIQFMPINTLYQLYAHEQAHRADLERASRLLLIPDLLHAWLSGVQASERTNATTTQCWDPVAGRWAGDLLERLNIPTHLLPPVVEAGAVLGGALPGVRDDIGPARIIAPATHDTGSAIVATPTRETSGWAYISSGTWSLVGAEVERPILTSAAQEGNWTNEGGVFGTTRFLKNVMGLWLLQECQRAWARDGQPQQYDALLASIDDTPPRAPLIDPDDLRFLAPDDMPAAINAYLREHGEPQLHSPAEFTACVLQSLVLRYCQALRQLERITGVEVSTIHVLGGGSRNAPLNQWLADAFGAPVVAGPTEATALGNALMQLVGLGELGSLAEIRDIAARAATRTFTPRAERLAHWAEAQQRFDTLNGERVTRP